MLRKLMKYEFRASSWLLPICLLAMALLYGAGWVSRAIGVSQLTTTLAVGLVLVGVASLVVALVTIVTRFFKGLFGAEGYLAQTLPVGKGQLILSKAIVAFVLILAAVVMVFASVIGMMHLLDLLETVPAFNDMIGGWGGSFLVYTGVMMLVQLAVTISELYFAMTLANIRLCQANSILFSVLFYFGVQMAAGVLEVVALLLLPIGVRFGPQGVSFVFEGMLHTLLEVGGQTNDLAAFSNMTIGLGSLVLDVALIVGLLFATRWLMTYKTSVK